MKTIKGQSISEWIYEVIDSSEFLTEITDIFALPANKLRGQKYM